MKIRNIIIAAATFFTAVSCAELEDNSNNLQPETKYTIYANVVETKTSMTDGVVTWKNGDAIKVAVRNSETANAALAEFKNTAANGIKTATFEGKLLPSHKNITAIYPASAYNSESASGSLVTIPAEQFGVAGNFPVDAAGSSIFPAFAYCEGENADGQIVMNFKHVGGLFGVEIPEYLENITKVELECAGAALAGDFNLAVADAENASLTSLTPVSKITLQPAAGAKVFAAGKYYVAMAPGKYTGIKITLTTAVGGTFVRTSDTFTYEIKRNGRVRFNLANIIANAKVGDCFLADGTWADATKEVEGKVDGKEVIGYVISTEKHNDEDILYHLGGKEMYSMNADLAARDGNYLHGYVASKTIDTKYWASSIGNIYDAKGNNSMENGLLGSYPYLSYVYKYGGPAVGSRTGKTTNHDKCLGYSISKYWRLDWKYNITASLPSFPANSLGWYVPSTGDNEKLIIPNLQLLKDKGLGMSGNFWTSSTSNKGLTSHFSICYNIESKKYNYQANCKDSLKVLYLLVF